METKYNSLPFDKVKLMDFRLLARRRDNLEYMMKLSNDNLIRNFEAEAGIYQVPEYPEGVHGGWENPFCQLRGHFMGHWLSGAAQHVAATGDAQLRAKADDLVDRLADCQEANGGQWAGSIPAKYLDLIANHIMVWAPQYTLHKTFMGLLDMYEYTGNKKALNIAEKWANWFFEWSSKFSSDKFNEILDIETGGMLEIWARMYGYTNKLEYKTLMERYYRRSLFDAMLEGRDMLTNMHANTTIPEIMGAAVSYLVTGEKKWLDICMAYWDLAVTKRGMFCTGGQTLGEVWTPPEQQSARLGDKNQEHCVVYNMMRLADFLFKITGEVKYADYFEQNLYNGIFAQGYWRGTKTNGQASEYPYTGLLTYFLPLRAGGRKGWATETQDFFCCHGTLVQANATHTDGLVYTSDNSITVCQYFSYGAECELTAGNVNFLMEMEPLSGQRIKTTMATQNSLYVPVATRVKSNPHVMAFYIKMQETNGYPFTLRLRVPWWIKGDPKVSVDGEEFDLNIIDGFIEIDRPWEKDDIVYVEFARKLSCWPLPDAPNMVAFMDGPVVLAGLVDSERTLYGDIQNPETMLREEGEREWGSWIDRYHTLNLDNGFTFIPLYMVGYEKYTVYFNVEPK